MLFHSSLTIWGLWRWRIETDLLFQEEEGHNRSSTSRCNRQTKHVMCNRCIYISPRVRPLFRSTRLAVAPVATFTRLAPSCGASSTPLEAAATGHCHYRWRTSEQANGRQYNRLLVEQTRFLEPDKPRSFPSVCTQIQAVGTKIILISRCT